MLRRLPWNYVSYDGSPDRMIEPVSYQLPQAADSGTNVQTLKEGSTCGYCVGFEIISGHAEGFAMGQNVGF